MGRCTTMLPGKVLALSAARGLTLLLIGGMLWSSPGCANRPLSPSDVPPEFAPPPKEDLGAVNLSRLTNYAANSNLIGPGDMLDVAIVTALGSLQSTTTPVRVGDDGVADIPLVGKLPLAGFNFKEAEDAITAAAVARGVFVNPHVIVGMRRKDTNRVTVIGGVKSPGVYPLPRGASSLLSALVAAGGLSEDASPDVEIRRAISPGTAPGTPAAQSPRVAGAPEGTLAAYQASAERPFQTVKINLVSAAQNGNLAHSLNDGDVVMVNRQLTRPIHVMGLVRKPGQYPMLPNGDLHMLDAVAMSGGATSALADKVLILRRVPGHNEVIRIETSIVKAKQDAVNDIRLAPGDVVSVEGTPFTFAWDIIRSVVRFGVGGRVTLF